MVFFWKGRWYKCRNKAGPPIRGINSTKHAAFDRVSGTDNENPQWLLCCSMPCMNCWQQMIVLWNSLITLSELTAYSFPSWLSVHLFVLSFPSMMFVVMSSPRLNQYLVMVLEGLLSLAEIQLDVFGFLFQISCMFCYLYREVDFLHFCFLLLLGKLCIERRLSALLSGFCAWFEQCSPRTSSRLITLFPMSCCCGGKQFWQ